LNKRPVYTHYLTEQLGFIKSIDSILRLVLLLVLHEGIPLAETCPTIQIEMRILDFSVFREQIENVYDIK